MEDGTTSCSGHLGVPTPAGSSGIDAAAPSNDGRDGCSSDEPAYATHELIGIIGDRWSVTILIELGDKGAIRSSDLRRAVEGISQKMLTTCVRRLEARGFVSRSIEPSVPVKVTYDLTWFGRSFFAALAPLRSWADAHVRELDATRSA